MLAMSAVISLKNISSTIVAAPERFYAKPSPRYCNEYVANHDDNVGLKADLERFVHGIELDPVVCADCRSNLDGIAKDFGVENVGWDLLNTNALSVTRYDGQMDFVVGNPPYVRVHNLEEGYDEVKSFRFAEGGMTDLYLAFYELGLRMINGTGKLCYITPSSWLSSVAATNMRKYVMQHRTLAGLIDLGHQQVFENVTAYTMIALFDARHQPTGSNIIPIRQRIRTKSMSIRNLWGDVYRR